MHEPAAPYASCAEIVSDRLHWVSACLANLVMEARASGWLEGATVIPVASADRARELIVDRIAATSRDIHIAPMQWMSARLALSDRELDLLWLLTCVEIDPAVARLAQAFATPACADLSVQIAERLVRVTHSELESLSKLGLIELMADPRIPAHRRPIRIADRVIQIARGELHLDSLLEGIATLHPPVVNAASTDQLHRGFRSEVPALITALGPSGAGRATILADAAGACGVGTLRIHTTRMARESGELQRQLRVVLRECCLFDVVPMFLEMDGDDQHPAAASVELSMSTFAGPVLATCSKAIKWKQRPVVVTKVAKPDATARANIWREHLMGADEQVISDAATAFEIRPGAIVAAARNVLASTVGSTTSITALDIQAGVRSHIGDELSDLATRIEWKQTWDDLVLPSEQFEQIIELVARVRHRSTVLEKWGFAGKVGKGIGTAALFSGPPGTGKTMVAGLIAAELGLDLYQVDLSKIVSKYIGETEKQLAALFDAAETGHAIILFDEADSLFAKRSEVKSSNDRYANLEVNYLLQRIESFTGIALLTTNHETAIDEAFRRRLALHVRFPMPEEQQREQMWTAMVPAEAPMGADLDMGRLAREFEMSGGYIKNAMLRAAYLAAEDGERISMTHLWNSARAEYEAMGKVTFQIAA